MLRKYLNKENLIRLRHVIFIIGGFIGSFVLASLAVRLVLWVLTRLNIPIASVNQNILSAALALIIYLVTLFIFVQIVKKIAPRLSASQLGMSRMPVWSDIFIAPLGFIVYFILAGVFLIIAAAIIPGFDVGKTQDVGFSNLNGSLQFLLAFITLVALAPVAEEVLFRGYLIGSLKNYLPSWAVVLLSALIFASMHGGLNVVVDTFALGIVLAVLRFSSGSIWASILVHMMKNSIAFYLVFINPSLLTTIGG